jgi:hypothetical protein
MENGSGAGIAGLLINLIILAIFVVLVISLWKVFEKAGKPGWAALIPIYNLIVLLEIVDRPLWWLLLFLCAGPVGQLLVSMDLAENFGKSKLWGIGMLFFLGIIGYPLLAFSDAQYTKISRQ